MKDRLRQPDRSLWLALPKPAWHPGFNRQKRYAPAVILSTIQIYDRPTAGINGVSERYLSRGIKKIACGFRSMTNHYIPHGAPLMDILG
jgi:hypothetical protein